MEEITNYVNVKKDLSLYASIKNKSSLDKIEKLIQNKNRYNVNSFFVNYDCTAMGLATELGLTKTVKLLIKYGAHVSSTHVEIACINGHYKIVKVLLNANPDIIKSVGIDYAIPENTYWNKWGGQSYTESSLLEVSLKIVNYLLIKGVYVIQYYIDKCREYSTDSPDDHLYYQIKDLLVEKQRKQNKLLEKQRKQNN